MNDLKNIRFQRWTLAGSWTGIIYATLYIARPVCEFFKQYSWFPVAVNISIFLCIAVIVGIFLKKKRLHQTLADPYLFLIIAGYGAGMMLISIPEERLHFIEYGILAALVYWALILDLENNRAYAWAFVITSLIGVGDEGIQYLLPNRYYQFQDVCLNSASAALGLIFIFVICRQKESYH